MPGISETKNCGGWGDGSWLSQWPRQWIEIALAQIRLQLKVKRNWKESWKCLYKFKLCDTETTKIEQPIQHVQSVENINPKLPAFYRVNLPQPETLEDKKNSKEKCNRRRDTVCREKNKNKTAKVSWVKLRAQTTSAQISRHHSARRWCHPRFQHTAQELHSTWEQT